MSFYFLLNPLAVFICRAFFHVKVYGRQNIPKRGGVILASNHLSYLDPVVVAVASPRKLNFFARHDLFSNPFFGWLIYSLGAFPVKRDSADKSAIKEAIHRLKSGKVLVVFPQGTRAVDGITIEPQPGIGFLAVKAGVPVVPVFIKGTDIAMPKDAKTIRPAKIEVHFGKQISSEGGLPYQNIALSIMDNIRRLAC